MEKIPFVKMQGAGNDYIYIDCFATPIDNLGDIHELARRMSDRHFGVGSDGIVLIMPSDNGCDVRMRMFNSDGSEAEMCGNASRCVAKYSYEHAIVKSADFTLQTKAGVKIIHVNTDSNNIVLSATVDMGEPAVLPSDATIPGGFQYTAVSMGNPHCVIFVDAITDAHVHTEGPKIETYLEAFPQKTNVEFAQVIDRQTIRMRVWERGAGETLACGTGACATLVAAVVNGLCDRKATLRLLGGNLVIEWNEKTGRILMTGPAEYAFEGVWSVSRGSNPGPTD
ncbi:MAG: diaminopimelate epimerase [Bacteroidales bacterium]|nr:diaminopimelate epimerase [Bacteroidales bacterium]